VAYKIIDLNLTLLSLLELNSFFYKSNRSMYKSSIPEQNGTPI